MVVEGHIGMFAPAEALLDNLAGRNTGEAHPSESHGCPSGIPRIGHHHRNGPCGIVPQKSIHRRGERRHSLLHLFESGLVVVEHRLCCVNGEQQVVGMAPTPIDIEFKGLVDQCLQPVLVDVGIGFSQGCVTHQFHEVEHGFGKGIRPHIAIGMESDLYHSLLRIGHLEINGVGYPLRYGKRGEGGIVHGMPFGPPPHPAPALGFLGAVIPSGDQGILAGRKRHVLVEKHRLVPPRAQCQHATL